jgi:hypothetical protein
MYGKAPTTISGMPGLNGDTTVARGNGRPHQRPWRENTMKVRAASACNEQQSRKDFWIVNEVEARLSAPVELTLEEMDAVAGGPEVESGSSN